MSFKLSRESLHPKFPPPRENQRGKERKPWLYIDMAKKIIR